MGRAEERTNYILDRLAREGEVSVAQLASDLGVSPVTVRASLKSLDEQGYLVRTARRSASHHLPQHSPAPERSC